MIRGVQLLIYEDRVGRAGNGDQEKNERKESYEYISIKRTFYCQQEVAMNTWQRYQRGLNRLSKRVLYITRWNRKDVAY